jgi:hypothetical protein
MKRTIVLFGILALTAAIIGGRAYLKYLDGKLDGLTDQVDEQVAQGKWKEADRLLDQGEARHGSHPAFWLLRAKVECGRKRLGPCLDAYVKAVPGSGVPDAETAKTHLSALLDVNGRAEDLGYLTRAMRKGDAVDVLVEALKHPEHDHRWNATAQLEALGEGDEIDYVGLYILDLGSKSACEDKKRAAEKLAELRDKDALEPLKLARADSQGFFQSVCLGDAIDKAIKQLEGS